MTLSICPEGPLFTQRAFFLMAAYGETLYQLLMNTNGMKSKEIRIALAMVCTPNQPAGLTSGPIQRTRLAGATGNRYDSILRSVITIKPTKA
jgi:hypothetical protein